MHPTEEKISHGATLVSGHTELLQQVHARSVIEVGTLIHHTLLRKETKWTWGSQQERAFSEAKNPLQADSVLVHFDPAKPLILACDASDYGLGAVLSHLDDSDERPIAFVSRTLNPAEKNYSRKP